MGAASRGEQRGNSHKLQPLRITLGKPLVPLLASVDVDYCSLNSPRTWPPRAQLREFLRAPLPLIATRLLPFLHLGCLVIPFGLINSYYAKSPRIQLVYCSVTAATHMWIARNRFHRVASAAIRQSAAPESCCSILPAAEPFLHDPLDYGVGRLQIRASTLHNSQRSFQDSIFSRTPDS